jgi:hypothetical protein
MKGIVLLVAMVLISLGAEAQYNQATRQGNGPNKFYFGGGGGLGAGTDINGYRYNYFSLLPVIGYRLTDQVSVGASITYQRYNYPQVGTSFTQYGAGPFVRYTLNPVFFQAEYDVINAPTYNNYGELVRSNYSRFLIGLGYVFPLGRRGAVNALAMYDLLYKTPSVFISPVVLRVYFTF